jgi:DivIVA domain-containing protein
VDLYQGAAMSSEIRLEDIESPSFSTSPLGYKREEVDAFLRNVAKAYDQVLKESVAAKMKADRVFESLGQEAGILMQNARDAAVDLRLKSETEAKKIRDEARRNADRATVQADQLKRKAQEVAEQVQEEAARDADRIRNEAKSDAERTRQEIDQLKRDAEETIAQLHQEAQDDAADIRKDALRFRQATQADATVFYEDVHRSATQVKREAENKAASIRATVEREVAERIEKAEARVRALQEMEIALRQRLQAFELKIGALEESGPAEIGTSPRSLPKGEERPHALP